MHRNTAFWRWCARGTPSNHGCPRCSRDLLPPPPLLFSATSFFHSLYLYLPLYATVAERLSCFSVKKNTNKESVKNKKKKPLSLYCSTPLCLSLSYLPHTPSLLCVQPPLPFLSTTNPRLLSPSPPPPFAVGRLCLLSDLSLFLFLSLSQSFLAVLPPPPFLPPPPHTRDGYGLVSAVRRVRLCRSRWSAFVVVVVVVVVFFVTAATRWWPVRCVRCGGLDGAAGVVCGLWRRVLRRLCCCCCWRQRQRPRRTNTRRTCRFVGEVVVGFVGADVDGERGGRADVCACRRGRGRGRGREGCGCGCRGGADALAGDAAEGGAGRRDAGGGGGGGGGVRVDRRSGGVHAPAAVRREPSRGWWWVLLWRGTKRSGLVQVLNSPPPPHSKTRQKKAFAT